jgi:signal peptidase I
MTEQRDYPSPASPATPGEGEALEPRGVSTDSGTGGAAVAAGEQPDGDNAVPPSRRERILAEVREWLRVIVYVAAFYFALTALVVEGYYIPSSSMEPTLYGARSARDASGAELSSSGDRVLALKGVYLLQSPERGDIVIFTKVSSEWESGGDSGLLVKRIVGLPGEELEIRDHWLRVRRPGSQGWEQVAHDAFPEGQEYVNQGSYGALGHPVRVPDDHYFVLGDNTWNSNDSRVWGFVPRSHIRGKVVFRFWPLDRLGWVH